MADIPLPQDHREAVRMLPANQHPFGAECGVNRVAQAVFFHYDITPEVLERVVGVLGGTMVSLRMADPDTPDGKDILDQCTRELAPGAVLKLKLALRRLCRADQLAPLKRPVSPSSTDDRPKVVRIADPKGKSSSSSSSKGSSQSSASSSASGSKGSSTRASGSSPKPSASSSTSSAAATAAAAAVKEADDADVGEWSDGMADVSDEDLFEDVDNDDVEKRTKSSGEVKCFNQLLSRVANDVSSFPFYSVLV